MDETLLQKYSKKIFGFALSKTQHEQNAQDLSQEILTALFRSLQSGRYIDNMDAWVHTICCYTWSNYLTKEKRYWHHADLERIPAVAVEGAESQEDMLEELRREVAYLSRIHREITVSYYYEGKNMAQIAEELQLAAGTVKWHLFEVRKKLKEAITMEQTEALLSYKPMKLRVGHSGTPGPKGEPNSYFTSLLTSNICLAMYEQPLTVEELARSVGAAAAYVEDELKKLEYSDLVKPMGKGKYQTNFIIRTMDNSNTINQYFKTMAEEVSESVYACVNASMEEIRNLKFHGSHLNDTFLLWLLIPYAVLTQYWRSKDPSELARFQPIERKDGGKYIAAAQIVYEQEEYRKRSLEYDIVQKYVTNGIKSRCNDDYYGFQIESWWSGLEWRDFNSQDLSDMGRAVHLMSSGEPHNDYDKTIISRLAAKGFVSINNGELECLIPYFTAAQHRELDRILHQAFERVELHKKFGRIFDDMFTIWKKEAPSHISEQEIGYQAINEGNTIVFAVMEYLERISKLPLPSEEERKRLTTIIWRLTETLPPD